MPLLPGSKEWINDLPLQNGDGVIECWHIEEYKQISITLDKTQSQMDKRFYHKTKYTEPHRRENGE